MTNESANRVRIDFVRGITTTCVVVTLAAAVILASEIILILFLGILFGVFLTKVASWLNDRISIGYRASLAVAVGSLLLTIAGGTAFFFVQINTQIEKASEEIDTGMKELGNLVEEFPVLRSAVSSTPFVSEALSIEQRKSKKPNRQKRSDNAADDQTQDQSDKESPAESTDGQSSLQLTSMAEPIKRAAGSIGRLFKTTLGLAVNSLLIFFVGLFLAVSPSTYRDGVVQLVPASKRDRATEVLDSTSESLWRWLIGRFGSMLATGVGAFLILLVLGVPMAGTLGILTALLTFVPNIGAAIALLMAVLVALPQGNGTVAAVIGGYMVLQLVESYVVTPLIQQKAVSLPPALLIAFQAIMGVVFGFIGAAVASPVLAAVKTMVQMLYVEDYLGDTNDSYHDQNG